MKNTRFPPCSTTISFSNDPLNDVGGKGLCYIRFEEIGVESFAKRKKGNDTVRLTAESIVEYLQLEYLQWSDFNTGESIYRRGG